MENAYIYAIFLPKIKVGRPPYLALWGASPLGKSINDWWDGMTAPIPRERERERERERRHEASDAFMYAMWGTWKERQRKTFRNISLSPEVVAHLMCEDMAQRASARHRTRELL